MTGVLKRRALRTRLKQQDRTGGHRAPVLSCSGRLPSVSGTIKIFKRPVQITCCRTAWLLSHATTACHAEKCAHTHTHTQMHRHFTLTGRCQEARGIQPTSGWRSVSRWLASGTLEYFALSRGAMSLKGHTSARIPVARALIRQRDTHIDPTGGHRRSMWKKLSKKLSKKENNFNTDFSTKKKIRLLSMLGNIRIKIWDHFEYVCI